MTDLARNFMQRALDLGVQSRRSVLPNPCVGAVLVNSGQIIGAGYHEKFGGPHAEVNAIESVKDRALLSDSTLYVTLEPCSHTGKTPPCAELIIRSKIPRVVLGCRDPFPQVAGRGIKALKDAGIEVREGLLHDECVIANSRFILAHKLRRPYIILKWAQTSDQFIAPNCRVTKQISCPYSQQLLHYWRGAEMAIAVGSNTAREDNPRLTARQLTLYNQNELPPKQPIRVMIGDGSLLPRQLHIFEPDAATILFIPNTKEVAPTPANINIFKYDPSQLLLPQICHTLYEQQILSIIIEGGAHTLKGFIESDLWDEARVFTAPSSFGSGVKAPELNYTPDQISQSGIDTLSITFNPKLASRLGIDQSSIMQLTQPLKRSPD